MSKISLYPHQVAALEAIFSEGTQHRRPLAEVTCGGGKSLIAAAAAHAARQLDPKARVMITTPRKELTEQNLDALHAYWSDAPEDEIGVMAASLKRNDVGARTIIASLPTLYRRLDQLQRVDILIVDEAHLMSGEDSKMMSSIADALAQRNPNFWCIGLTGTPYTMSGGHLVDAGLFSKQVYSYGAGQALQDGQLKPLVAHAPAKLRLGTDGVQRRAGQFVDSQLQRAIAAQESTTNAAVTDSVRAFRQEGRSRGLWFAAGVAHGEYILRRLQAQGVNAEAVFGKTPKAARKDIIDRFRDGRIEALVGRDVFLVGFDVPAVDFIAWMRPTRSPNVLVQGAMRGARLADGVADCSFRDYTDSLLELGPLDDPQLPNRNRDEFADDQQRAAPMKACPQCARVLHAGAKSCDGCGHVFPVAAPAVKTQPNSAQILSGTTATTAPRRQSAKVSAIDYLPHSKQGKPLSMRVQYTLGLTRVSEWVLPEHEGYPAEKSAKWWRKHSTAPNTPPPRTALEALARAQAGELRTPIEVVVEPDQRNPEFLRIVGRRFGD